MTQSLMSIGWMLLALVLSASIGLERQIRGKSAGIRTQAIVGLTACLMMLISKYGFSDILVDGITRYDPSRVASQIVSGIGFLGAGIILTRHGAIRPALHRHRPADPARPVHPHAHPRAQGHAHHPLHARPRGTLDVAGTGLFPRLERLRRIDPHGFV